MSSAVSFLTLAQQGIEKGQCNEQDVFAAIYLLKKHRKYWNIDANSIGNNEQKIYREAISAMQQNNAETISELWGYLLSCNVNPHEWIRKMGNNGYKMLNMAFENMGTVPNNVHNDIFKGTSYVKSMNDKTDTKDIKKTTSKEVKNIKTTKKTKDNKKP